MTTSREQRELCARFGAVPSPVAEDEVVGISLSVRGKVVPVNGLRHPPKGGTTGWYIWAGEELESNVDFFKALHVAHLQGWCPAALKFLALPPGYRFLIAGDCEDVWFDPALLEVK